MDKQAILEALLYTAGDEGIDTKQLLEILDITKPQLIELIDNYSSHGLEIHHYGQTYVLTTKKRCC